MSTPPGDRNGRSYHITDRLAKFVYVAATLAVALASPTQNLDSQPALTNRTCSIRLDLLNCGKASAIVNVRLTGSVSIF